MSRKVRQPPAPIRGNGKPRVDRRGSGAPGPNVADGEAFVERVRKFRRIAADASSLIVLKDIGALEAALGAWRLTAPASIILEAADAAIGVESLGSAGHDPDRALLAAAVAEGLPILSEDRKVLMAAEESGMNCFDAMVALELLRGLGFLDDEGYGSCRASLVRRNAYRPYRLAWAREVGAAVDKLF